MSIQPLSGEHKASSVLDFDIRFLKGVGEQRARLFEKLDIRRVSDLLRHFPRDYEDRTKVYAINELTPGQNALICARVSAPVRVSELKQGITLTKTRVCDNSSAAELVFFNKYVKNLLKEGESYYFYGKVEGAAPFFQLINPEFESSEGKRLITGRILPVYPLTKGLTPQILLRSVSQALEIAGDISETLPPDILEDFELCTLNFAYQNIHFPQSFEACSRAARRLAFEELLIFSAAVSSLKGKTRGVSAYPCDALDISPFFNCLPYKFTGAQIHAASEILSDMQSGNRLCRLLQGDVGSGKTAVAAAAAYFAIKNGMQVALMAPTQVLARQHFTSLSPLFEGLSIKTELIVSGMPPKKREEALSVSKSGDASFIIGTHALLTGGVEFARLGLVICDEQHRFGVAQRAELLSKGKEPHLLVMSATPIPRTLALTIYGDLDVSVLNELPPGRHPVETFIVPLNKRAGMYDFLHQQVGQGRQGYIICPVIEESEQSDLLSVQEYEKKLRENVFPKLRVSLLHGRMPTSKKEAVMTAFAAGEIDILVSTTVVEVGIDQPNASVMVIENADRFGLSQLHQLRGRVGRGKHKSYCFLLTTSQNPETLKRLSVLKACTDGFELARQDLALRGPGDFFGVRQHGLPALRFSPLAGDTRILTEAKEAFARILSRDPSLSLPEHSAISESAKRLLGKLTSQVFS